MATRNRCRNSPARALVAPVAVHRLAERLHEIAGVLVNLDGHLGVYSYLPLRASRRPSSVNAALRSRSLPLTPWRMTHPRSTARATVACNSSIPLNLPHCIGCPSVASYSL